VRITQHQLAKRSETPSYEPVADLGMESTGISANQTRERHERRAPRRTVPQGVEAKSQSRAVSQGRDFRREPRRCHLPGTETSLETEKDFSSGLKSTELMVGA
jgi:hypothetical protein